MPTDNLRKLLKLYRERLDVSRRVLLQLEEIPPSEGEATIFEQQKWRVREGQKSR